MDRDLPVGRPREGTELRIVDPDTGRACPAGVSGEIVIVGDTVAKGYYENPEKTQEALDAGATIKIEIPTEKSVCRLIHQGKILREWENVHHIIV